MRKTTELSLKRHVAGPLLLTEASHGPKIFDRGILHREERVQHVFGFFLCFLTGYSIYLYKMFGVLQCQIFDLLTK